MRSPCSAARCRSASCGGRRWTVSRLSLDLREVADIRGQYEKLRDEHGFRLFDYSVDSDSASPRACFQFSEDLAKRFDFSPFVALAGNDKPAITSEGKQLCVDGLKHGERYNINLRAGLPSTVKEGLPKSAEFNIYVRDRKPFVRFTGRAYVLPRTGQRGIPVVSVNTPAVLVNVFRIGDRNLINTVIDSDFQRPLSRYQLSDLGDERGMKVWTGELATATTLNQEVTTAFPVDQVLGDLQPGVYVMTAAAKNPGSDDDYQLATQWFIVSDLGISAFSGNDGIHVFVNSLASTDAVARAEVRLIARNNEVLATRKTDESGHVLFEAGLARGEGGLSPAMLTVAGEKTDYAFLSLKSNAFDLTDRGVSGRAVPTGADAFVYAERGVYRSNETVYLTALLRDGQGNAVTGGPLTLVVERPDGVEYRRAVSAGSGRGRSVIGRAAQFGGPGRHLAGAGLRRPQGQCGRRDHLHGRGLHPRAAGIRFVFQGQGDHGSSSGGTEGRRPLPLWRAGLQPAARGRHAGRAGSRPAGLPRLPVRRRRRADHVERAHADRGPAGIRRQGQQRPSRSAWPSRRPRRGRRRRRSSSAWRKPAAARSSARSCCRWCRPRRRSASSRPSATRTSRKATRPSSTCCSLRPTARRWRGRACATSCSRSSRATNGIAATRRGSMSRSRPRRALPTAN